MAVASAASAQDARVAYGDLDLSTAAGAQTLDQRINTVAADLCRNSRAS
ncbi:MAG: UrcA family protein, partial [Brevundimonas sp.]